MPGFCPAHTPVMMMMMMMMTRMMMKIIKIQITKRSKLDPTSFQNPEKWVSGVTGELPGETLGPKRRPSEKKTSKKELFPPPSGSSF